MAAPDLVTVVTTLDLISAPSLLRQTSFTVHRSWLLAWDKVPAENRETLVSVMRHLQEGETHPGLGAATEPPEESSVTVNGFTLTYTQDPNGPVLWTSVTALRP